MAITKIQQEAAGGDTTRYLYIRNNNGDQLAVYIVAGGLVAEASNYRLGAAGSSLWLYNHSLLTDEQAKDSTRIDFQDKTKTVIINERDHYQLFPDCYTRFKQETAGKHSIMALLNLLSDGLGDYPVSAALALVNLRPVLAKQIKQATIKTQRTQADMIDTWACKYFYNRSQKLDSIVARSAEEIRFTKKVQYQQDRSVRVNTYLNIESRQTTYRYKLYSSNERAPLKWRESYLEIGKNRETQASVTLAWRNLGMLQKQELTKLEIMQLLKPAVLTGYMKKHKD